MEMTAISLLFVATFFFGGLFPSFEKRKTLKWFFIGIVLLNICINLAKSPSSCAFEVYSYAVLIIISQISIQGRSFWSRRFGRTSVPEITPEIKRRDVNFFAMALVVTTVGGFLLQTLGMHFMVPAVTMIVFGGLAAYFIRSQRKYIVPAATLYFANFVWNIVKAGRVYEVMDQRSLIILTAMLLLSLLGILWLLKKPGAKPLIFLSLLIGIEFLSDAYKVFSGGYAGVMPLKILVTGLGLFFVWEFLLPLIFAIVGLRQMRKAQ